MKRRDFVKKASIGAAGSAVLTGCGSSTRDSAGPGLAIKPRVNWRLASSFPRALDTIFGAAQVLGERVSALTDGRFTIRSFPYGELVPYDQVLESVQKGTIQMGHSASYYFVGLNPSLAFDCTVPFGLTASQYNAWMYYGDGRELMRELFADFNIINLPGGNTGTQMGGWFRNPVNSLADLRGLRMRIPGLGGKVMDEMGVTVQMIAGGDIYPALERGTIDATEWTSPYDDEKLGFYQVAGNYYYPGWWEPGPGLSFYVNRDAWNRLPSDYQAAVETAAAEANLGMLANYDAKNPAALARLLQNEVQLRRFPDDMMLEAERIAIDLQQQEAAVDPAYNKILESYNSWKDISNRWFSTSELTYATFAFRQT